MATIKYKRYYKEIICLICGKSHTVRSDKVRSGRGLVCGSVCRGRLLSGENAPGWKGGVSRKYAGYPPKLTACPKCNFRFPVRMKKFPSSVEGA